MITMKSPDNWGGMFMRQFTISANPPRVKIPPKTKRPILKIKYISPRKSDPRKIIKTKIGKKLKKSLNVKKVDHRKKAAITRKRNAATKAADAVKAATTRRKNIGKRAHLFNI